jgi:hypothetical protein
MAEKGIFEGNMSHGGSKVRYFKVNVFRVEYVSDFGAGIYTFLKY